MRNGVVQAANRECRECRCTWHCMHIMADNAVHVFRAPLSRCGVQIPAQCKAGLRARAVITNGNPALSPGVVPGGTGYWHFETEKEDAMKKDGRMRIAEGDVKRLSHRFWGDFFVTCRNGRNECVLCSSQIEESGDKWKPSCDCWVEPGAIGFQFDGLGRRIPVYR
jgi:hypothetical protein